VGRLTRTLLALALAACAPASTVVPATSTLPASPSPSLTTPPPTPSPSPSPSPTIDPKYAAILAGSVPLRYQAQYRITGTVQGTEVSGTGTREFFDAEYRIQYQLKVGAGTIDTTTFRRLEGFFVCVAAERTCYSGALNDLAAIPGNAIELTASGFDLLDITLAGSRFVAGDESRCFDIRPRNATPNDRRRVVACYLANGTPTSVSVTTASATLNWEITGGGQARGGFSLPYPVKPAAPVQTN